MDMPESKTSTMSAFATTVGEERTEVVKMSPAMAQRLLSAGIRNRPIIKRGVADLVRVIIAGHWRLTHQGIAIDHYGRLLDGQHRLSAIVQSGITVPIRITYGVDPKVMSVIDVGRNRTPGDFLALRGAKNWRQAASSLRLLSHHVRTDGDFQSAMPRAVRDNESLLELTLEYPNYYESVQQGVTRNWRRLIAPAWAAHLRYQLLAAHPIEGAEFLELMDSGAGIKHGSVLSSWRDRLLGVTYTSYNKRLDVFSPCEKAARVVKLFNLFVGGKDARGSVVRWRRTGPKPEKFPTVSGFDGFD